MTTDLGGLRRSFRDLASCRIATLLPGGAPHAATRWFVWSEDAVYVSTRRGDAVWRNVERDPRASLVIDRGRDWSELAGVRVSGGAELMDAEHPDMRAPMSAWHEKYRSMVAGEGFERLTSDVPALGFLRVVVDDVDVWDHRGSSRSAGLPSVEGGA